MDRLEQLYRADKKGFEKAFFEVYPEISDYQISVYWKSRLEFGSANDLSDKLKKKDILFLLVACLFSGFLIQIPNLFDIHLESELFYQKNAGLIVLFGLSLYAFLIKDSLKTKQFLITFSIFVISAIYINLLPSNIDSQSVLLAYLHLILMLWCLYGVVYIDFDISDKIKRISYIRYNGELAVLAVVIIIAGGILTAVTLGLFSAIEVNIERFVYINPKVVLRQIWCRLS